MESLHVKSEVASALSSRRPVVALESVIVAHGLPRPRNLEVARACEAIVRDAGAVPATLALRDGAVRVGLSDDELETLAGADGVAKANLSNMAAALAGGGWGATTVAASLWICARAGIRVFATGGIGGVHRGFDETLDISSDLTALGRFPVICVCAGVKSLLDVGATREQLETLGVPVLGWRTNTFPRFYLRESRWGVDARVESAVEVVRVARLHWDAGGAGILVVVPVPEVAALGEDELEQALALAEFERRNASPPIEGRDVTPFILDRLRHHTRDRSLEANVALIRENVRVAAEIALAGISPVA